ncbi:MAG: DUF302 domain-containing protein [Bacteroidota bacterium]
MRFSLLRPLAVVVLLSLATGCGLFDEAFELEATVPGLVQASSRNTDFRAYDALEDAVRADGQAVLATRVEFAEAARSNGIELLPTRVALINAGAISQPLVAADPRIALEFPQPLLIYTANEERVVAGYNTAAYLAQRYDVGGLPALDSYEERWQRFTLAASSNGTLVGPGPGAVARHVGIIETVVEGEVPDAFRRLNQVVRDREDLQTVARYDHTVEGGRPAITLVLNQPETAARFVSSDQTVAIDALLRVALFEDLDGQTHLAYVDPAYTADRHGIADDAADQVATLRTILADLVAQVVE